MAKAGKNMGITIVCGGQNTQISCGVEEPEKIL